MLDIQFIRDNPDQVTEKSEQKGYEVNVDELLRIDGERRQLLGSIEELRRRRNENADKMKGGQPTLDLIEEGKRIKVELAQADDHFKGIDEHFEKLLKAVPNMSFDFVPV